ncbi:DNA ligase [Pseudoxanthomonas winnipegensis]|uniref:DNA ligase n=2 Tax=Pseudoxanthomonas winnipegensis TaxID=2480810 RepID=A0A4Q8LUV9_9GAMM|nr:DNA ligase [Pseudoxanthomonas winnipegensis]TAA34843.1 DNA ligase [Pseudoxanthomonas winnipegensis]
MRVVAGMVLVACLAGSGVADAAAPQAPPMLATAYRGQGEVAAYLVSEKLDGVRGRWDGRALWTRGGEPIAVPAWFTRGWPPVPMEGELWIGRGQFDVASAGDPHDPRWRALRFMVFDLPAAGGAFAARVARMQALLGTGTHPQLRMLEQRRFDSRAALDAELDRVVQAGGEGLMLQHRAARYLPGRSDALLKYKRLDDAEARVVGHVPGQGRHAGRLGALLVETPDGRRFRIGSGLRDAQRDAPPPLGTWVTYQYNGLTGRGLPRFARFLRVREESRGQGPGIRGKGKW